MSRFVVRAFAFLLAICIEAGSEQRTAPLGSHSTSRQRGAPERTDDGLLIRSYLVAKQFAPAERAMHLAFLAQISADIAPEFAILWSEELFQLTFTDLPLDWNRSATQRNALITLARVNSSRALELLPLMDLPVVQSSGVMTEDLRANAARAVFSEAWRRHGSAVLEKLQREARNLGDTGQYPYGAMAPVIKELANRRPDVARALFAESARYYTAGSRFEVTDREYLEFLQALQGTISSEEMRPALETFVKLVSEHGGSRNGETWRFQVHTDRGIVTLQDSSDRLILEALPLIRKIDPDWANRIIQSRAGLREAGDLGGEIRYIEETLVKQLPDSAATPSQLAAAQQRGLEMSRLNNIEALASEKPDEALRLALTITDPALRSVAFARLAAGAHSSNPKRAAQLFEQSRSILPGVKEDSEQLDAITALAQAAAQLGDTDALAAAIEKGFDLGEELFQQDLDTHPYKPAYAGAGLENLHRLTQVAVKWDSARTVSRIMELQNEVLRAYLLVSAAQALHELKGTPPAKP